MPKTRQTKKAFSPLASPPRGQMRSFFIYEQRQQGASFASIARQLGANTSAVQHAFIREEILRQRVGEDVVESCRDMARELDLAPTSFAGLITCGVRSLEAVAERVKATKGNYIRGVGPQGYQRIVDRLTELGLLNSVPIVPIPMTLPHDIWERCLAYWNNQCAACGAKPDGFSPLHQDHWVPRRLKAHCPGTIPTNIVPLCWQCNSSKSGQSPYIWLVKTQGKVKADQVMRRVLDYFDWWRKQGEA